jgi:hypothetical protein
MFAPKRRVARSKRSLSEPETTGNDPKRYLSLVERYLSVSKR